MGRWRMLLSAGALLGCAWGVPGAAPPQAVPNMNGEYVYWRTPDAPDKSFPTNLMSYPGGVESFDAYHGPINSTYGMVWWTTSSDDLPQEIVERFAGKVMAIVAVEMDQVRRTPSGDVSVPINVAYNHHHNTLITGHGTHMEVVSKLDPRVTGGKHRYGRLSDPDKVWLPVEHEPSAHGVPTSAMFDDGNGGEYRKSLHVYGPPFAQLVESPTMINGIAMQVDTWNREKMNLTGSPFVPGPHPRNSLAPTSGPDAIYSGLLECPVTTRIRKTFEPGSAGFNSSFAAQAVSCPRSDPAPFCVKQGVNGLFGAVSQPGANGTGVITAGKVPNATQCEDACAAEMSCIGFTWVSPKFSQPVWRNDCYLRVSGTAAEDAQAGIVTGWRLGRSTQVPASCATATHGSCTHAVAGAAQCFSAGKSLPGIPASVTTQEVSSSALPPGCSVAADKNGGARLVYNANASSTACCDVGENTDLSGVSANANVTVSLAVFGSNSTVQITLSGPNSVWFGVGFDARLMQDAPYTIIVEGAKVSERKLGKHVPGELLKPSVSILSTSVSNDVRTVVLSRPMVGATASHYSFSSRSLSLGFISAIGVSSTFGPHGAAPHGAAEMRLWPTNSPVCVCSIPAAPFGSGRGSLEYMPTGSTVLFDRPRCDEQPRGDLLAQRNPTCDIRSYIGGLDSCRHGWHLLDADQEIPWQDQPLIYYKKFRVYFQEYDPSHHRQIQRVDWCIGSHEGCEYDVPQCEENLANPQCRGGGNGQGCKLCNHTITGTWAPAPEQGTPVYLASIHHHCHAPTCLYMETWRNDTGELLCRTQPVYGGTNGFVNDTVRDGKAVFDEPGYIANPPCMWGRPEDGLAPPPKMNGVTIFVKAVTNSTYAHHGEMAISQAMLHYGEM